MTTISITIPGEPVTWQRVRRGKAGQAYVPCRTRTAKRAIALLAQAQNIGRLEGALVVEVWFVFPRPKRTPKSLGPGRLPHAKRPDIDNLTKLLLDALSAHFDDGQVCAADISKVYAAEGEDPHTEVSIILPPEES